MVSDCGEILSRNPTFLNLLKHADVVTLSAGWSEPDRDRIAHAASGTIAAHIGPDMKKCRVHRPPRHQQGQLSQSARNAANRAWHRAMIGRARGQTMTGIRQPCAERADTTRDAAREASHRDPPRDQRWIAEP